MANSFIQTTGKVIGGSDLLHLNQALTLNAALTLGLNPRFVHINKISFI
jgi:hypothetical protein